MPVFSRFFEYPENMIPAQPPSAFGARAYFDLPYIGDEKHVRMTDLFMPKNRRQKRPVILHVHGGAWTNGSRAYTRSYCACLASKGFAVLSIDYACEDDGVLPKQVRDVLAAMRWIRTNASIYGLDPNCVFLSGDSSGAYLALVAYIIGKSSTLRLIYSTDEAAVNVRAIALVSPVTDLRFITDSVLPSERALRRKLFGENYADSPFRFCSSVSDVLRPEMHLPPVYLVSAEDDFFSSQSSDLHHVLNRRNVENRFRFFPSTEEKPLGHGFPVLDPTRPESKTVMDEIAAFFCEKTK